MPTLPLAELLPFWLRRLEMTRADFARAVGVDAAQVTRWCGKGQPDPASLPAICAVLKLGNADARLLYEASGVPLAPELLVGGGS